MKLLGKRIVRGKRLDKLIEEYVFAHERSDFYHEFFTKKEKRFLKEVYMTVYKKTDGGLYVRFTSLLPSPGGHYYNNMNELIGKTTGYNTTILSIEKCYIVR